MADLRRPGVDEEMAVQDDGERCQLRWWMLDPEASRAERIRREEEWRELMRQLDELGAGR